MSYIYHQVPKYMEGGVLYPLNVLKDKYPDIYEKEFKKYTGREFVTDLKIPIFDCLWNDVLHFGAVPPADLKNALVEAGMSESIKMSFYQIDSKTLNSENCVVYLNNKEGEDWEYAKAFVTYNEDDIPKYSTLKQNTKDYYKEKFKEGQRPNMFAFVPHILYRGSVDISDAEIIEV